MESDKVSIATVIHEGKGEYDHLLKEFAEDLLALGVNVQGLLTRHHKKPMIIYDLTNQQEFTISQDLGKNSDACALDLGKLSSAAFVLRKALEDKADLVIINRFGTAEAEGKGFIEEIQALVSENIPILTLTADTYLEAWHEFTGGLAVELAPNKEALHTWFNQLKNKV